MIYYFYSKFTLKSSYVLYIFIIIFMFLAFFLTSRCNIITNKVIIYPTSPPPPSPVGAG